LEQQEIILVSKQFIGRKPSTTYNATERGKLLFSQHLNALEELINRQ